MKSSLTVRGKIVTRVGKETDLADAVIRLMDEDIAFRRAMQVALFNHSL